MKLSITPWITVLALSLVSNLARAEDVEALATELARLRTDVEALSEKLDEQKEETKAQLRIKSSQKNTLEADIQTEELRVTQLQEAMAKHKERVQQAGALEAELEPAVLAAIEEVKGSIRAGLPFRVQERLSDVEKLEKDVKDKLVTPSVGLARLWSRVEDELRLANENGMYQQVIELDGEEILADVVRLGMVALYFQTPDGRSGRAVREGDDWKFVAYATKAEREQLQTLVDSMKNRVRVGFFEIPNALPQEVR